MMNLLANYNIQFDQVKEHTMTHQSLQRYKNSPMQTKISIYNCVKKLKDTAMHLSHGNNSKERVDKMC